MKNKKHIAMRCNQEQFEAIKPKLEKAGFEISIETWISSHFLTNYFLGRENNIANITQNVFGEQWLEQCNEKIFLEACGIETIPTLEEVREYFKDAKTVRTLNNVLKISKDTFHLYEKDYWYTDENGYHGIVWNKEIGYAKILTYKTPKFEITKEQILEMAECKLGGVYEKRLKEWFPEVFEIVLEVGKWYIVTNIKTGSLGFEGIGQYTKEKPQLGLLETDLGFNFRDVRGRIWRTNGNIRLATPEEVTEALNKEAVMRGFTHKRHIIDLKGDKQVLDTEYKTVFENGSFFHGGHEIMKNAQWATVIKTKTIQQAEELLKELGREIKIVS